MKEQVPDLWDRSVGWRWCLLAVLGFSAVGGCGEPGPINHPPEIGEWRQWRGPDRNGKAPEISELPATGASPPSVAQELWRRPVGAGFSAPMVADGRLFLLETSGREERLTAFEAVDGIRLWDLVLGPRWQSAHGDGPRSTPAVAGEMVVALSSWGHLVAADVVGGVPRWRADLRQAAEGDVPDWGFAGSPWIDGPRVIVQGDGVFAFDLEDGRLLWRLGEGLESYASPGRLSFGDGIYHGMALLESELVAWRPEDGQILWRHAWGPPLGINIADPVPLGVLEDPNDGSAQVFLSSSYGQGSAVLDIRRGVSSEWQVRERWRRPVMRNVWGSSIVLGSYVYGFDESFLVWQRLSDGEVMWKGRGFGDGGSLVYGRGVLWILTLRGELVWVAPDPDRLLIVDRKQVLDGPSRAPPTLAGSMLWVRDGSELVALTPFSEPLEN